MLCTSRSRTIGMFSNGKNQVIQRQLTGSSTLGEDSDLFSIPQGKIFVSNLNSHFNVLHLEVTIVFSLGQAHKERFPQR